MTLRDFFDSSGPGLYLLPLDVILLLLLGWLIHRYRQRAKRSLAHVLSSIAYERVEGLIIPNTDDGEIQLDHLLLTAHGLLIIDAKSVVGTVFGSDKMQDWTVISDNARFTFGNPQPALYDRIAAVRQIVGQVPVTGRIVFLDGAEFTKGTPSLTCGLDELSYEFGEEEEGAAIARVNAFRPHWEQLMQLSRGVPRGQKDGRKVRL